MFEAPDCLLSQRHSLKQYTWHLANANQRHVHANTATPFHSAHRHTVGRTSNFAGCPAFHSARPSLGMPVGRQGQPEITESQSGAKLSPRQVTSTKPATASDHRGICPSNGCHCPSTGLRPAHANTATPFQSGHRHTVRCPDIASRTPEPSANPSLGVLVGLTVTCPVQTPEICVPACMARIGATHDASNKHKSGPCARCWQARHKKSDRLTDTSHQHGTFPLLPYIATVRLQACPATHSTQHSTFSSQHKTSPCAPCLADTSSLTGRQTLATIATTSLTNRCQDCRCLAQLSAGAPGWGSFQTCASMNSTPPKKQTRSMGHTLCRHNTNSPRPSDRLADAGHWRAY